MKRLLHINASPRGERSRTRRLSRQLARSWQEAHPEGEVLLRDVGRSPVPLVDEHWIAAAFTPQNERTPEMREAIRLSDQLADEFLSANAYVLGVPMYNFGVPAALKAYIDQVVRLGRTFLYEPEDADSPYKPLLHGKKMFVVAAYGDASFGPGGAMEPQNFLSPYLQTVFGFVGITDITFVHVSDSGPDVPSLRQAQDEIAR